MENHKNPVIPKSCRLLGDLSEKELQEALLYFSATQKSYRRGDFLYSAGMPVSRFGIVLAGTVQVFMENIDGERMVMASVSAGESFGESLAFLGVKESPIWAEAQRDTSVLWLSPDRLRAPSEGAGEALRTRFITLMAKKALASNDRIQILSKRTLRKKLLAYFSQCVRDAGGSREFTVPFDRAGMADYLGADRAALSRELSCMKKEGLLDFRGSFFCLAPRTRVAEDEI
ncbi:MAG: Crp/Fnr family transcriptional regulator [Clostridia bacterium]|nr:Crp/Fnr family transcriptional regulator [Clostridia bacterium]